jgi:DNA polymerase IV
MSALCRDCFWQADAPVRRCPSCGSMRILAHAELDTLAIAHIDCDAFYASVEKRDRPELRDLPVIVGGGKRGVVTTCCYIARMSGVRSAMPMFRALKLCPQAVVIKPDFSKYTAASRQIKAMFEALTPLVQPLSLDEAWLDLSGTQRLNRGSAAATLAKLQARIEREVGITVSIGLAPNKFLAKIASDLDKPKGFAVIGSEAQAFLADKPVGMLPGVGPAMVVSLEKRGLRTIGDIARADLRDLAAAFGDYGLRLHQLAHGRDSRVVDPEGIRKSISAENTFFDDIRSLSGLEDELWPLCEKVGRRARASGLVGQVATLKLKTSDFRIVTRRRTLPIPIQTARSLFEVMRSLLREEATGDAYRLIGAGLSDLLEAGASSDLFAEAEARALKSEQAIDVLRAKFGAEAVVSGRALKAKREPH